MEKAEIFRALQKLAEDGITVNDVVEILALVEDAKVGRITSREEVEEEEDETIKKSQNTAALNTMPEAATIDEVGQKLTFAEDLHRRIESINEDNTVSREEAKRI